MLQNFAGLTHPNPRPKTRRSAGNAAGSEEMMRTRLIRGASERSEHKAWDKARSGAPGLGGCEERLFQHPAKPWKVIHVITRLDHGGSAQNTMLTALGHDRSQFEPLVVAGHRSEEHTSELQHRLH